MKKMISCFALIGFLFGCDKNEDSNQVELLGKWKLIEVLSDPGDGSGSFKSVNIDKTVTFYLNETIESNGSLCGIALAATSGQSGTYSVKDSIIIPDNCPDYPATFRINNSFLILGHRCIEACISKYQKVK